MTQTTLPAAWTILDNLNLRIALLDRQGLIVACNRLWQQFADENGDDDQLGRDYLQMCTPAIAAGIRAVMSSEQAVWQQEYPFHSPRERRFFRVEVSTTEVQGQLYIMVVHENITEQRVADLHSRALNATLMAQNQLITHYTFAASHALQEPLRRLTATSSALEKLANGEERERVAQYARINLTAAQQMSELIESLGDYAVLAQTKTEVPARLKLGQILQEVAESLGLELDRPEVPPVLMSRKHGQMLIRNVLENIQNLIADGSWMPRLTIRSAREGDFVHLHVPLALNHEQAGNVMQLFQPHGRAALGLSQLLVQQYGGRVWVEVAESGGLEAGVHLTLPAWRENDLKPFSFTLHPTFRSF